MTRAHSSGRRLFSSLSLLLKNLWKTKELEWKTSSQEVLKDLFFDDGPKGIPQNFEEGQRRRRCTNFLMFFFLLALVLLSFFTRRSRKDLGNRTSGHSRNSGKTYDFCCWSQLILDLAYDGKSPDCLTVLGFLRFRFPPSFLLLLFFLEKPLPPHFWVSYRIGNLYLAVSLWFLLFLDKFKGLPGVFYSICVCVL